MQNYRDTILNGQGNPIVGATIMVVSRATGQIATIYSDENGAVQANPMETNAFGEFMFYAEDGSYDIAISKPGIIPRTIIDVDFGGTVTLPPGLPGKFSSLSAKGEVALGGEEGAEALRVAPVQGQTNYVQIEGALPGNSAKVVAAGPDVSVSLNLQYKNDGAIRFGSTTGADQFRIVHAPDAVNLLQVQGAGARSAPTLTAVGTDDHIGMKFNAKGMGAHSFTSNNGEQMRVGATVDAANYVCIDGGFTGMPPAVKSAGANTNIGMDFVARGAKGHRFSTHGGASTHLVVGNGTNRCFNHLHVYGSVLGAAPGVIVAGPDANIHLDLNTKGTGVIRAYADLKISLAGKGLCVKEGTNAKQGVATLVAGAVTVANTSVTTTSRIFLTSQQDGGTPGFLRVTARVSGTSFTITSSNAADTSVVAYQIFEQA